MFRLFSHPMRRPRARCFRVCEELLRGKIGLEIGGHSGVFTRKGLLPIYPIVGRLDNCNYCQSTVWGNSYCEGLNFRYDKWRKAGYQFICEATNLTGIPSEAYEFILSSHTLEHIANPLRAMCDWMRVLKENGIMVLIVPHKDCTFDHLRPVTLLSHLIEDFDRHTGEEDLSHLPEILKFHDLKMDTPAGSLEEFKRRSERNLENRCLHHHVFDTKLVISLMNHIGLHICEVEPALPFHIIAIGKKGSPGHMHDNRIFMHENAEFLSRSPFPSDRA